MNQEIYRELRDAEMPEAQAEALARHMPDWSQFATKADLDQLRQEMSSMETRLILWMVGVLIAGLSITGALVSAILVVLR